MSLKNLICTACSKNLEQFFNFKCTCLYTEDAITPFMESEENGRINLWDVYVKQKDNQILTRNDEKVCRLCLQLIFNTYISLSGSEGVTMSIRDFIAKHFPEVASNC